MSLALSTASTAEQMRFHSHSCTAFLAAEPSSRISIGCREHIWHLTRLHLNCDPGLPYLPPVAKPESNGNLVIWLPNPCPRISQAQRGSLRARLAASRDWADRMKGKGLSIFVTKYTVGCLCHEPLSGVRTI